MVFHRLRSVLSPSHRLAIAAGVATLAISGAILAPGVLNAANPLVSDSRIRTLVYNPNEVFKLITEYGYQSNIEFSAKEKIVTLSVGDVSGFKITPTGNRLFIRAMQPDKHTNMTVITNERSYQFDLSSYVKEDDEIMYVVRFYYPEDDYDMKAGAPRGASAIPVPSPSMAPNTMAPAMGQPPIQGMFPAPGPQSSMPPAVQMPDMPPPPPASAFAPPPGAFNAPQLPAIPVPPQELAAPEAPLSAPTYTADSRALEFPDASIPSVVAEPESSLAQTPPSLPAQEMAPAEPVFTASAPFYTPPSIVAKAPAVTEEPASLTSGYKQESIKPVVSSPPPVYPAPPPIQAAAPAYNPAPVSTSSNNSPSVQQQLEEEKAYREMLKENKKSGSNTRSDLTNSSTTVTQNTGLDIFAPFKAVANFIHENVAFTPKQQFEPAVAPVQTAAVSVPYDVVMQGSADTVDTASLSAIGPAAGKQTKQIYTGKAPEVVSQKTYESSIKEASVSVTHLPKQPDMPSWDKLDTANRDLTLTAPAPFPDLQIVSSTVPVIVANNTPQVVVPSEVPVAEIASIAPAAAPAQQKSQAQRYEIVTQEWPSIVSGSSFTPKAFATAVAEPKNAPVETVLNIQKPAALIVVKKGGVYGPKPATIKSAAIETALVAKKPLQKAVPSKPNDSLTLSALPALPSLPVIDTAVDSFSKSLDTAEATSADYETTAKLAAITPAAGKSTASTVTNVAILSNTAASENAKTTTIVSESTEPSAAADTATANFAYSLDGSESISPWQVFDDGKRTYIQFSSSVQKLPRLSAAKAGESTAAITGITKKGNYYILPGVYASIKLEQGNQRLTVYNDSTESSTAMR